MISRSMKSTYAAKPESFSRGRPASSPMRRRAHRPRLCYPRLTPTPMGWTTRDWFLGIDPGHVFDRAGNIGPTLWWNGEIIGSWAIAPNGDLRTKVVADRGAEAHAAIDRAASQLHARLNRTATTPAIRTPLEQALTTDDSGSTARPGDAVSGLKPDSPWSSGAAPRRWSEGRG